MRSTARAVEADARTSGVDQADPAADARVADRGSRGGSSRWFVALAIAVGAALFLAHLAQIAQLRVPITYYDEGGYLGNARYMVSGYGRNGGSYFAGYSLLLTPAAAITHAATAFFRATLITNAILAVVTAALALLLSRRVMPQAPKWVSFVAAGIVAACPFAFTFVGMAMSENALIPATMLVAVLVGHAACTKASWPRICIVLVGGYTYWVTARGVIVAGAALFALLILTFEQRRRWLAFAGEVALMGVVLVAGQFFENLVRGSARVHGVTDRPNGLLAGITHPGNWRGLVADLLGRFAYLGLASAGFILIGLVVAGVWLAPRARRSPSELARVRRSVSAFALVALIGTILANATAVAGTPVLARLDFVYYGRYAEAVAMPTIVIGVSWLLTTALSRRAEDVRRVFAASAAAGLSIAVMAMLTKVLATQRPPDSTVNPTAIIAYFPVRRWLTDLGVDTPTVTKGLLLGAAAVTVMLVLIAWRARWFAVLPIIVLAAASVQVHDGYLRPGSRFRGSQGVIASAIADLGAHGIPTACVDYSLPLTSFWFFGNYQFLLPKTDFVLPPPEEVPDPTCPLVITSATDWLASHPTDRLVAMENHEQLGLFLRTSLLTPAQRARAERDGLYIPGAVRAPLPADAYRATIDAAADTRLRASSDLRDIDVSLTVKHDGAGAPWPSSYALTDPAGCGRVEVALSVENAQGETVAERTVPTPSALFPGQTWHLRAPLAAGPTKPELAAGQEYRLRARLVQRGVRDFGGPDGEGVTVPLGST